MTPDKTMTAAVYRRFGGPEEVHLEQRPIPSPKSGEVLVRVHASTVSIADHRSRARDVPPGLGLLAAAGIGVFRPKMTEVEELGPGEVGFLTASIKEVADTRVDDTITDKRDAEALYAALEEQVVPIYYDRDVDGLPRHWIKRMMNSISTLAWRFSAHRMLMDYTRHCYVPAAGGLSCEMNMP